jgi:hypothetical protein
MAKTMLAVAAIAAAALVCAPEQHASAAMLWAPLASTAKPAIVHASQDGPRFHHGKRAQSVYCLRRNYWWFYRPYTTAQEDYRRCEPYFQHLESARGRRGVEGNRYFK